MKQSSSIYLHLHECMVCLVHKNLWLRGGFKMYRPNRDNAGQCHSLSFGTMPSDGLLARTCSFLKEITVNI